jgi:uncharacterized membrane protein SirB2
MEKTGNNNQSTYNSKCLVHKFFFFLSYNSLGYLFFSVSIIRLISEKFYYAYVLRGLIMFYYLLIIMLLN